MGSDLEAVVGLGRGRGQGEEGWGAEVGGWRKGSAGGATLMVVGGRREEVAVVGGDFGRQGTARRIPRGMPAC